MVYADEPWPPSGHGARGLQFQAADLGEVSERRRESRIVHVAHHQYFALLTLHLLGYGLQHAVALGGHVSRNRWRRVDGVDDAAVAQFGTNGREILQAAVLQDGA